MGYNSKIQWTSATWNPWHGCKKVSEGCKYCYMYRDKERYGQDPTKVIKSKSNFNAPLKWKEPQLIFTCSWSDWFIEEADKWRDNAWEIIRKTPQHTYQILTKRPERILKNLPTYKLDNVWIGVSVESENHLDRIGYLQQVKGYIRFISFEPLLEYINTPYIYGVVDWIIIGGESGNSNGKYKYRPCELIWIEELIQQSKERNVPIFIKQLGTHLAKKLKLKDSFGGNIDEFPENLKIRNFPK